MASGANSVKRVYEKDVKGYVYCLSGGAGHKLQLPKTLKSSPNDGLGLTQPYLVFQVFVPEGAHVSFEIGFSCERNVRRRIVLSTSFIEVKPHMLHCQVPLPPNLLPPERWTSLCVHLPSLARALFPENSQSQGTLNFKAIEHVGIGATCRVRKVFTLKTAPRVDGVDTDQSNDRDSSLFESETSDPTLVPKGVDFPPSVNALTSVVYPSRLSRGAVSRERSRGSSREGGIGESGTPGRRSLNPGSRGGSRGASWGVGTPDKNGRQPRPTAEVGNALWGFDALTANAEEPEQWHVAFGSRVGTPSGKTSRGGTPRECTRGGTTSTPGEQRSSFEGDADDVRNLAPLGQLSQSQNWSSSPIKQQSILRSPMAVSAAGASRVKSGVKINQPRDFGGRLFDSADKQPTSPSPPVKPSNGGWDFMNDGVGRDGTPPTGTKRTPEKYDADRYIDDDRPGDERSGQSPAVALPSKFDHVGDIESILAKELNLADSPYGRANTENLQKSDSSGTATHWNDSNGVAFYDGKNEETSTSQKWSDLKPASHYVNTSRGATPIPGTRPGTGSSQHETHGLGRNYARMYTPDLVLVSDRKDVEKTKEVEENLAHLRDDSNHSSTAEKENEGQVAGAETSPKLEAGVEKEKVEIEPPTGDLDLVYDPILNFYYDPKTGKYFELTS